MGKSSIINRMLGENRLIVSDIAGTTRDAVDTDVTFNGREYVFIDTRVCAARIKSKRDLEHYMIVRTVGAVERADVVILVIDAVEGVTEQDAKIAGIAHERGKAIIIAVNKWDAVAKGRPDHLPFYGKGQKYPFLYAVCGNRVHFRKDRAETSQAV